MDDVKLKVKGKVVKHDQQIKEYDNYAQQPVKLMIVEKAVSLLFSIDPSRKSRNQQMIPYLLL